MLSIEPKIGWNIPTTNLHPIVDQENLLNFHIIKKIKEKG